MYCAIPASRSMRPSSASCSTTTATNVLVTLPMFHGMSRSTGRLPGRASRAGRRLGDRTVAVEERDAGTDELARRMVGVEDASQQRLASRVGLRGGGAGAVVLVVYVAPLSSAARRSWPAPRSWSARWPRRRYEHAVAASSRPAAASVVVARTAIPAGRRPRRHGGRWLVRWMDGESGSGGGDGHGTTLSARAARRSTPWGGREAHPVAVPRAGTGGPPRG